MASNCYDVLGVSRDSTVEDIKKAFKKAALAHHPDKGGDAEKFKECNAAVETLTDERKRSAYDSALVRAHSRDGLHRGSSDRDGYNADRGVRASSVPRPPYGRATPVPKPTAPHAAPPTAPPKPPRRPGDAAVEIPANLSSLGIRELKDLLSRLGVDHEGSLEKEDLLNLLRKRIGRSSGDGEVPPCRPERSSSCSPPTQQPGGSERNVQTSRNDQASQNNVKACSRSLRIKVISIGCQGVGKSCMIKRYCEGKFVQKYITTIGVDYGVKLVQVNGLAVKVNFFDMSGSAEHKDVRVSFYENTGGVLLVFDVTNRQSFDSLSFWVKETQEHGCTLTPAADVVLCANKTDAANRVVSLAEGKHFALEHGMQYFETSAASGECVEEALNCLFLKVVDRHTETRKRLLIPS